MKSSSWLLLGQLGTSFVKVVSSEWQAVRAEMRRSARISVGALVTLVFASAFTVVALAALMLAAAEALTTVLQRWAAFLVLALVLAGVALILVQQARRKLNQIETPDEVVKRRWRDHRRWLRRQLHSGEGAGDE